MHLTRRPMRATPRRLLIGAVMLGSMFMTAGCQTHHVALNYTCPGLSAHAATVLSRRGAIGLPRVGFTPGGLKLAQKCQVK